MAQDDLLNLKNLLTRSLAVTHADCSPCMYSSIVMALVKIVKTEKSFNFIFKRYFLRFFQKLH